MSWTELGEVTDQGVKVETHGEGDHGSLTQVGTKGKLMPPVGLWDGVRFGGRNRCPLV